MGTPPAGGNSHPRLLSANILPIRSPVVSCQRGEFSLLTRIPQLQSGKYDAQSDLRQIGVMISELRGWGSLDCDPLRVFVNKLLAKKFASAIDAVQEIPV